MCDDQRRLCEALAKVAETASSALREALSSDSTPSSQDAWVPPSDRTCIPKTLPEHVLVNAAKTAVSINPANAPHFGPVANVTASLDVSDPLQIAVLTSKYWGPAARTLSVSFMEATPADLRSRILQHMNAWTRTVSIRFAETQGVGEVRISRGSGGYWSYVGTDILHIASAHQTMNLQGFSMGTPESEFIRVIRHETGHTLGAPHEHMRLDLVKRIDREKAYEYFLRTQGWDRQTVDQQVLTSLDESSLMGTRADETSIMCYQLPGSITLDGKPILGGVDINATDYAFMGKLYPKTAAQHSGNCDADGTQYGFAA